MRAAPARSTAATTRPLPLFVIPPRQPVEGSPPHPKQGEQEGGEAFSLNAITTPTERNTRAGLSAAERAQLALISPELSLASAHLSPLARQIRKHAHETVGRRDPQLAEEIARKQIEEAHHLGHLLPRRPLPEGYCTPAQAEAYLAGT